MEIFLAKLFFDNAFSGGPAVLVGKVWRLESLESLGAVVYNRTHGSPQPLVLLVVDSIRRVLGVTLSYRILTI